jgi:hypothetical protein
MLSGCAAPYQEPASNAVARIRLASSQTSIIRANIHMNGYPSGTCINPMRIGMVGGLAELSNEVPLGIPGGDKLPPKSFVERKIPAGQRYLFTVRVLSGGSCVSTGSFIPAAGSDYEIRMGWDTAKTVCNTTLHQVSKDSAGNAVLKGEPTFVREPECRAGLN